MASRVASRNSVARSSRFRRATLPLAQHASQRGSQLRDTLGKSLDQLPGAACLVHIGSGEQGGETATVQAKQMIDQHRGTD